MIWRYGRNGWFVSMLSILVLVDIAVLLNIPVLRQILGFIFLAILPGALILRILNPCKLELVEEIVLSVGLSISFLMFFGLVMNNVALSLGYMTPLSTTSLLVLFNVILIIFIIVGHGLNKDMEFSISTLDLKGPEKMFLIVPVLFPALSIFGMYIMNITNNNLLLLLLLLLIPCYVAFVCIFNREFPERLYPVVILLITTSLLLIFMLRSPHICGHDVHTEYGIFFRSTLRNLHSSVLGHSILDACLSISLLPTIFQTIMGVDAHEYLFKGVYVAVCSFSPLVIYIISKEYVSKLYAFIASFFFISQSTFLVTAGSPRTNVAIFFVALTVMVFLSSKIDPIKKKILLIVFLFSTVVSHYSTTYIFFFIILLAWLGAETLSKSYVFEKLLSLKLVLIFFVFIFLWYAQVTEGAFDAGVTFIGDTISNLNNFFIEESRTQELKQLFGQELEYPILNRVNLAITWSTFIFIGIGVYTIFKGPEEMGAISNKKTKCDVEYLLMTLICVGLLTAMVVLPYISQGYGIYRLYLLAMVILSVCFVLGGITISKHLKSQAYLIILLVLIPYFLFASGAVQQMCGTPAIYTLNSEGKGYAVEYLHDHESCAAKLIAESKGRDFQINTTDWHGKRKLISQGGIPPEQIGYDSFMEHKQIDEYIYLSYNNVVNGKFEEKNEWYNMSEFSDAFIGKSQIYNNSGSEIWK